MHRISKAGLALLVAAVVACGSPPELVEPPSLGATSVDDGAPVRPTDTVTIEFTRAVDPESVSDRSIVLVRGAVDADLTSKIERAAVPDDERDLLAPLRLEVDGSHVRATPLRPLDGEALYTLVVTTDVRAAGQRLASTEERAFQTLPAASGAPWLDLIAPAPGSTDVVRNLRGVGVRFSRAVQNVDGDTLRIVDEGGEAIAARVDAMDEPGTFRMTLAAPLRPLRTYRIDASPDIRDDEDEPPFAIDPPPSFTAGDDVRVARPVISTLDLTASSGCLVAHLVTSPPADARLCIDSSCVEDDQLLAERRVVHPLAFGAGASVTIRARDESTAPAALAGPLAAPATSPRALVITEVLSRPKGPHYDQQFVEVKNVGATAVSLRGLELRGAKGVDVLPDVTVAPGGFALIVPSGFVSDDGVDPVPAAGTAIARVEASRLVGNGVLASGAEVTLCEHDDRPASRFSTVALKLAIGQSARRAGPCDVPGAYEPTPGGSTPGGP